MKAPIYLVLIGGCGIRFTSISGRHPGEALLSSQLCAVAWLATSRSLGDPLNRDLMSLGGTSMRKTALASVAVLVIVFAFGVWAQNKPQSERITNGPVVKKTTDTVAEISWSTDAPGSSIVKYGSSANSLNQTAEEPWGGAKESNGDYNHTVWIKNLKPNTTYYFMVVTGQGLGTGTETQSRPQEFHTMAK
jgi:Purple acid Phosphatase, N-terminal domain